MKACSLLGSKSSNLQSAVKKKWNKHQKTTQAKKQIGAFHHIYLLYLPESFYWRLIQNPVPAINYFYIHVNYCSSVLQVFFFSAHNFHWFQLWLTAILKIQPTIIPISKVFSSWRPQNFLSVNLASRKAEKYIFSQHSCMQSEHLSIAKFSLSNNKKTHFIFFSRQDQTARESLKRISVL